MSTQVRKAPAPVSKQSMQFWRPPRLNQAPAFRYGPKLTLPIDRVAHGRAEYAFWCWTVSTILIAGLIGSEIVGAALGWPKTLAHLGSRVCADFGIYDPWSVYYWIWIMLPHFGNNPVANTIVFDGVLSTTLVCLIGFSLLASRWHKVVEQISVSSESHGASHWATPAEVLASGLAYSEPQKPAIHLAAWYDPHKRAWTALRDASDKHVGIYAPTRAGKGVSVIVPTLLTWNGSMVVNDPKEENWQLSAQRRRKMGQWVIHHDPVCETSMTTSWNPLEEVRIRTFSEDTDARLVAMALVDPHGAGLDQGNESDHWRKVSADFLTGATLHICYAPKYEGRRNITTLDRFINDEQLGIDGIIKEMFETIHDPEDKMGWLNSIGERTQTHPLVAMAARVMNERPEGEKGSAMSSARSYTYTYRTMLVEKNTSTSGFSIDDIMLNPRGVSLYLVNTPQYMQLVRPHMRMLVNMIMSRFTGRMVYENGRVKTTFAHPLLFAQDEFTSVYGRMEQFVQAMAFSAGYGIRVLIAIQDYAQLEAMYGDKMAETIMGNIHTNIYFATANQKTADRVEKALGQGTYLETRRTLNYGGKLGSRDGSRNTESHGRPLMYAAEFATMDANYGVVMQVGRPPIYARKMYYYNEPELRDLVEPPPELSMIIPPEKQMKGGILRRRQAEYLEYAAKRIAEHPHKAAPNVFTPPDPNKLLATGQSLPEFEAMYPKWTEALQMQAPESDSD